MYVSLRRHSAAAQYTSDMAADELTSLSPHEHAVRFTVTYIKRVIDNDNEK